MAQKVLIVTIIVQRANQGLGETTMAPSVPGNGLFVTIWGDGGGEPLGGDQHTLLYGYTFLHMVSPVVRVPLQM